MDIMKSHRFLYFAFEISLAELESVILSGLHIGQYKMFAKQRLKNKTQTSHSTGNLEGKANQR